MLRDGLISQPGRDEVEPRDVQQVVPPDAVSLADEVGALGAEFPDREQSLLGAGEAARDALALRGRGSQARQSRLVVHW